MYVKSHMDHQAVLAVDNMNTVFVWKYNGHIIEVPNSIMFSPQFKRQVELGTLSIASQEDLAMFILGGGKVGKTKV